MIDVAALAGGHMTADMAGLTFAQIIARHNALLNGFSAGASHIQVHACGETAF